MKFDYNASYDLRTFGYLEETGQLPDGAEAIDAFHSFIRPRIEDAVAGLCTRADDEKNPFLLPSTEALKDCHGLIFADLLPNAGIFDRPLADAFLETLVEGIARLSTELKPDSDQEYTKSRAFGELFVALIRDSPFGPGSDQVALSVLASQLQHCFSEEMSASFLSKNLEDTLIVAHYEKTSALLTREILNIQQRIRVFQEMKKMEHDLDLGM